MGVKIREILQSQFFNDYYLIAEANGIDAELQGVVLYIIYPLFKENNWEELLTTLKAYLENESNCNIAAEKLFVHSNTVRYRISKIKELCNIDLEDPTERLKIEITLKFIEALKKEFKKDTYPL